MALVPFGYRIEGSRLVIDDQAATVVVRIFAEFTRPYFHTGLSEIADALNVDDIPTQRGGMWHASTMRYILRNQVYGEEPLANISRGRYARCKAGWPV